jgi:hypothetical protein
MSEFNISEAVETMQEARNRRQERLEIIEKGMMGLAAEKGWGNKDIEMTEERLEAAKALKDEGIGADGESEAKRKLGEATKCERNGGHDYEVEIVEMDETAFVKKNCQNCPDSTLVH